MCKTNAGLFVGISVASFIAFKEVVVVNGETQQT